MTTIDVLVRIYSEVTGQPESYVRTVLLIGLREFGADMPNMLRELPDAESQHLLTELRKEKAGILNDLIEGLKDALRILPPELRH